MRFINPKTDFAFKKIFGSDRSKAILLSFLNAILYEGTPVIVDLEILDPYLAPKIEGMKDTFVDVRAKLQNGQYVIIEMQVLNVAGFEKRILYNAAKAYSTQLLVGESYTGLRGVVALTITDFVMFPENQEMQSVFVLKEKTRLTDYVEGDLELVFVELPKFRKELEDLTTLKDKWLYFLRNAPDLKIVPEKMEVVPELKEAFQIANESNMSPEELYIQERKMIFIMDQRSAIVKAVQDGMRKGIEDGRQEGRREGWQEGRQEGMEKGRQDMAQEIARRLLNQMSDQEIAAVTGFSPTEIAALRDKS